MPANTHSSLIVRKYFTKNNWFSNQFLIKHSIKSNNENAIIFQESLRSKRVFNFKTSAMFYRKFFHPHPSSWTRSTPSTPRLRDDSTMRSTRRSATWVVCKTKVTSQLLEVGSWRNRILSLTIVSLIPSGAFVI